MPNTGQPGYTTFNRYYFAQQDKKGAVIDERFNGGDSMIAPRGGFFSRDMKWAVENEGVGPDIDVENWPKDVIAGKDPQLERAVDEALRLLKAKPVDRSSKEPPPPTWGVRKD